jgi:proteasome regulatory subunit
VLAEQKSLTIIDRLESAKHYAPETFVMLNKPTVRWADIGGLWEQIKDLKEVIELPLKKPKLFKTIGIQPPKGILLHGPPGCGKTLLAKALANSTKITFIELVGSELVHKYIGDGAKLVKEIFQMAKERAPSIIFIDEIDAIAAQRLEVGTSAEREVQRTFMQLLAEIDGFKNLDDVKIIGATNRYDILDPAVVRPGRLDRLIGVSLPGPKARLDILKLYTKGMKLKKVNMKQLVEATKSFSGAELRLVCTEAGYFAIRDNRMEIVHEDFLQAIEKVQDSEAEVICTDYINMFG